MRTWRSVTVGVADLDAALELWVDTFGFTVVQRRDGPDPGLARCWNLDASAFKHQALLAASSEHEAMLHLVEFTEPGATVREGAQVFDLCPKNLDIYVTDMPQRVQKLKALGHGFRTETYSEVTAPNGVRFREIHMPGHDDINIVLLELLDEQLSFTPQGYGGMGPIICIVDDAKKEQSFYSSIMGLEILSENILKGPEIEKMIGLPAGAALDVSIWGKAGEHLGQVEIIDYRGVEGVNLYPRARPPSRGILHVTYTLSDIEALIARLDHAGIAWSRRDGLESLTGKGSLVRFESPAGFVIEAVQSLAP